MEIVSLVTVQASQVDELGHLNHVAAVDILQYARDDWYQQAGLWQGRAWSGAETLGTLVLNLNLNYRRECFVDEQLRVVTAALSRGNKSFVLRHEILKADGSLAVDGSVTSLIMDMQQHQTLPLPQCLLRCFGDD